MTDTAIPKVLAYNLDWPFDHPPPSEAEVEMLILAYGNRFVLAAAIDTIRHFKRPARSPRALLFSQAGKEDFKRQMKKLGDKEARRAKLLPAVPPTPYRGTMGDWISGLVQLGFFPEEAGGHCDLWLTAGEYEALLQECEKE